MSRLTKRLKTIRIENVNKRASVAGIETNKVGGNQELERITQAERRSQTVAEVVVPTDIAVIPEDNHSVVDVVEKEEQVQDDDAEVRL